MPRLFSELFCYGVVSAVALAVDVTLLRALVELGRWHYLPASTLAFIAGALVAYVLSVRFVFRFRYLSNRTLELSYFVAIGVAGLVVNAMALSIAIGAAGMQLVPAKLVAAGCTFTTNFALRRSLLFSAPRVS